MNRTIRYSYLTKFATTAKESRAFDTMHCKYDLYGDIPKEPVENFETEGGAPHRSNAAPSPSRSCIIIGFCLIYACCKDYFF